MISCFFAAVAASLVFANNAGGNIVALQPHVVRCIGLPVNISCVVSDSPTSTINWEYFEPRTNRRISLYENGELINDENRELAVLSDRASGRSDLVISSVALQDAGKYRCYESRDSWSRRDTELIVIAFDQFCNVEVNYRTASSPAVDVSCLVSFNGNFRPSIDCAPSAGEVSTKEGDDMIAYRQIYRLTSEMTISCRLYFNSTKCPDGPETVYYWTNNRTSTTDVVTPRQEHETAKQQEGLLAHAFSSSSAGVLKVVGLSIAVVCVLACIVICHYRSNRSNHNRGATREIGKTDIQQFDAPDLTNGLQGAAENRELQLINEQIASEEQTPPGSYEEIDVIDTDSDVPGEQLHLDVHTLAAEVDIHLSPVDDTQDDDTRITLAMELVDVDKLYEAFDPRTRLVDPPPSVYAQLAANQ